MSRIRVIPRTKIENSSATLLRSLKFSGGGKSSKELMHALSKRFDLPAPLLTSCASAGLYYLLKALPEKKIYLPAYTCRALVEACFLAGRLDDLQLVDINLTTYGMDIEKLEEQIEPESIIIAIHQFGIPAPIDRFLEISRKTRSILVEDNAAAFGAQFHGKPTGIFGDVSLFSFEYSKTFSACGGGAVFFRDQSVQREVEKIQNSEIGKNSLFERRSLLYGLLYNIATHEMIYGGIAFPLWRFRNGYYKDKGQLRPARVSLYHKPFMETQAQLALNALNAIDDVIQRRKEIEQKYLSQLSACSNVMLYKPLQDTETSLLMFPIRVAQGDKMEFYKQCASQGVDLGFTFSYVNEISGNKRPLDKAREAARQVLNLPFYSKLSDAQVEKICRVVTSLS